MSSFGNLPRELFDTIMRFLSQRDLKRLCEVSKSMNLAVTPKLYSTALIRAPKGSPDHTSIVEFGTKHLIHTTELQVLGRTRGWLDSTCPHHEEHSGNLELSEGGDAPIDRLGSEVARLCDHLLENKLVRFEWNVGVCVPEQILGPQGCLRLKQKTLRELVLLTNEGCSRPGGSHCLSDLNEIRDFEWNGLRRVEDLQDIMQCLQTNATHLEALELGLGGLIIGQNVALDDRTAQWHAVRQAAKALITMLSSSCPSLWYLCLGLFPLDSVVGKVPTVFDFSSLSTLRLLQCPGVHNLLDSMAKYDPVLQLSCFELVQPDERRFHGDFIGSLSRFLRSFTGLQDLYLMLCCDRDGTDAGFYEVLTAILTHQETIYQLVLHQRTPFQLFGINLLAGGDHVGGVHGGAYQLEEVGEDDEGDDSMLYNDSNFNWTESLTRLFELPKLQYIGMSTTPHSMQYWLNTLNAKPSWRVVHLRDTVELRWQDSSSTISNENANLNPNTNISEPTDGLTRPGPTVTSAAVGTLAHCMQKILDKSSKTYYLDILNATKAVRDQGDELSSEYRQGLDRYMDWEDFYGLGQGATHERHTLDIGVTHEKFARTLDIERNAGRLDSLSYQSMKFLQWAFSPYGLPKLEVVTFGDFSLRGNRQYKYCRNADNKPNESNPTLKTAPVQLYFRMLNDDETEWQSLIAKNIDFFRACEVYRAVPGAKFS